MSTYDELYGNQQPELLHVHLVVLFLLYLYCILGILHPCGLVDPMSQPELLELLELLPECVHFFLQALHLRCKLSKFLILPSNELSIVTLPYLFVVLSFWVPSAILSFTVLSVMCFKVVTTMCLTMLTVPAFCRFFGSLALRIFMGLFAFLSLLDSLLFWSWLTLPCGFL